MTAPEPPRIDALQWLRLKGPLADLAELSVDERSEALKRLQLDHDDARALEALANHLPDAESRLPMPARTERVPLLRWQVGDRIGDYTIDGLLGRGGMGDVYAAHAQSSGERVALKVLRQCLEQGDFAHFSTNEQRALQRLDDPHVARFIEAINLPDGSLCLVLEQVDGEPLMVWATRNELALDQRLALFVEICVAVACAHQQLVVHRDLKPGNVLVTKTGQIKLLDFGIAKLLDEDGSTTQTHGGLYTLEYAAPEQVLRNPVSTATDIYALGVLLFHLLTDSSPYATGLHESLVKSVLTDKPRSIASIPSAVSVDRDLDRVIAQAMEKNPGDRYRSAMELANDVQAIRDGRPISGGGSRWYRTRKFVRRHSVAVATSALLIVVLLSATFMSLHWAQLASEQARVAAAESTRANAVADFLVGLFRISDPGVNRGDKLTANQILDRGSENLAQTFAHQPLQRARLQVVTGDVYVAMGEYERARGVLEPALATLRQDASVTAEEIAHANRQLGEVAFQQAAFAEAIDLASAGTAVLDRDHVITSRERVYLALIRCRVHYKLGELEESSLALANARKAATSIVPADLEIEATIHNDAANLANESGEYELARNEYTLALEKLRHAFGEDHYRTVAVRTNLGTLLVTKFDDFDGAQPLLEQALDQWEKIRGTDSAAYATTAGVLGELFRLRKQHDQAANFFRDSERAFRAALGDTNPAMTWPIVCSGASLADQGRYQEALVEYERALAIMDKGLPATEMRSNEIRNQIIDVLIPLQRYDLARELGTKSLALTRIRLPPDHPFSVNVLYRLGLASYGLGDEVTAHAYWQEALERAPRAFDHQPAALAEMRAEIADPDRVLREYRERAMRH